MCRSFCNDAQTYNILLWHAIKVPYFVELSSEILATLAGVVSERTYQQRDILLQQGQNVDDLFFIKQGAVKVCAARSHHRFSALMSSNNTSFV